MLEKPTFDVFTAEPIARVPRRLLLRRWALDRWRRIRLGREGYRRFTELTSAIEAEIQREFLFGAGTEPLDLLDDTAPDGDAWTDGAA